MSKLSVGIVGLPNAGKSTLFNALLKKQLAEVGSHPFTTVKPNTGVVAVSDKKLEELSEIIKPEKTTPASVTFVDIAGLVKGAHKGEGLGNEFLSHIKAVDVICQVVRVFENDKVAHVEGSVDPVRDSKTIETELKLKDIEQLERIVGDRKGEHVRKKMAGKMLKLLDKGEDFIKLELSKEEEEVLKSFQLLSMKPSFLVLNVGEEREKDTEKIRNELGDKPTVLISAKFEGEILELENFEQEEFRREMEMGESDIDQVILEAYRLLDLITFYTIKGGEEVRAWSLKKGYSALDAARVVHTDFYEKFKAAEVVSAEELLRLKSWVKAREAGKLRSVGRDYVLEDGEVIEFKI